MKSISMLVTHCPILRICRTALVMLGILGLAGCGNRDDMQPPEILYGQAECDGCKMIISDEAFSAAAVIVSSNSITKLAFDDIGCLLEYRRKQSSAGKVTEYVHDHSTHQWLMASQATLLHSESLRTPMASHLAACASEAEALKLAQRNPGKLVRFEALLGGEMQSSAAEPSERRNP